MTQPSEIDLSRFFIIAGGHSAFQLLWAGDQLGLYTLLSKRPGIVLEEIAPELGLKPYPCRVLLVGLAALGVLRKDGAKFYNAALIEQMMVKGKPGYYGPVLGWQAHIVYPGEVDFLEALKQGTNVGLRHFPGSGSTLYERLVSHPEIEQIFQDALSALSHQANDAMLEAYDFGRFSHIVDAGGGDGTNAIALARRYPGLKATVYDSESVCQIAREKIEAEGMADRVFTWTGDFLHDPFPPDVDAIFFCHIMTIWSMERNQELLRKCWSALPAGGAVVIFNMMGHDDDAGPLSTALGSPYFLTIATGEGMLHAWKDYEEMVKAAGFSKVTRVDGLPLDHGLFVAEK